MARVLAVLVVAQTTVAWRLARPWSNKSWCASVVEPEWPFAYRGPSGNRRARAVARSFEEDHPGKPTPPESSGRDASVGAGRRVWPRRRRRGSRTPRARGAAAGAGRHRVTAPPRVLDAEGSETVVSRPGRPGSAPRRRREDAAPPRRQEDAAPPRRREDAASAGTRNSTATSGSAKAARIRMNRTTDTSATCEACNQSATGAKWWRAVRGTATAATTSYKEWRRRNSRKTSPQLPTRPGP